MRVPVTDRPRITVLLALYDGCSYLREQLQSYLDQSLPPVCVLASDDRPGDGTAEVFRRFTSAASGEIIWNMITGPERGSTANFLHLLATVSLHDTDYVALSDQDDIWLPQKLQSAVEWIAPLGNRPVLLGTRSWIWEAATDRRRVSRAISPPFDFRHALIQNYAGGNTMVLNRPAMQLVQQALPTMPQPAIHDWWLYQLISGAGGTVLLDPEPRLLYRQHPGNQIGASTTLASKLRRFTNMLSGTHRAWMDQNLAALQANEFLLTSDSVALLHRLQRNRSGSLQQRLCLLRDTGLHRKAQVDQLALWIAAALGRL